MSQFIEDTLSRWIDFYHKSRKVGHTVSAINGAKRTEAHLVCHNHAMDKSVGVKTLIYTEAERVMGFRGPVVWDNCAITDIFIHSRRRIEALKAEITRLELALKIARMPKPTWWTRSVAKIKKPFKRLWYGYWAS